MTTSRDASNRWPWPPIIYTSAVALCWALQEIAPLALLDGFIASAPRFRARLVATGFLFDALAMIALARRRTAILPNMGASALVSSGVFAYSRNPIYLGNTLLLIGRRNRAAMGLAADRGAHHCPCSVASGDRARGAAPLGALWGRMARLRARVRRWL